MRNSRVYIVILFISIICTGCIKTKDCKSFDTDNHPLLPFIIDPNFSTSISFKNEYGDTVLFERVTLSSTEAYKERCTNNDRESIGCLCVRSFLISYNALKRQWGFNSYISQSVDTENTPPSYKLQSLTNQRTQINIHSTVLNDVIASVNMMVKDSIQYHGKTYTNILEAVDTTTFYEIDRFWIQKDVGLINFWANDTVWTRIN